MTRDDLEEMRADIQHAALTLDALCTSYSMDDEMDAAVHVHATMSPDRREDLYGGGPRFRTFQPVTSEGVVYFIRAVGTGLVKIGHTTMEPEARLAGLRTSSPHALVIERLIPGSQADERTLHGQLFGRRVHLEWFRLTPEEVDKIVRTVAEHDEDVGVCNTCSTVGFLGHPHRCYSCRNPGKAWL